MKETETWKKKATWDKSKWEDNIKTDDKKQLVMVWPGFAWLRQSPAAGHCDRVHYPSNSVTEQELLNRLSDYQFLKKGSCSTEQVII